jgi:hypothetical protein
LIYDIIFLPQLQEGLALLINGKDLLKNDKKELTNDEFGGMVGATKDKRSDSKCPRSAKMPP